MRKLWFALLFLGGAWAHEIRNPLQCHCITTSRSPDVRRRTDVGNQ
jgi:hypothetical protein